MMVRCVILPLIAAMLVSACAEPASREFFLLSDGTGEYRFQVAMNDSTASYDISFYTVIDRPVAAPDTLRSFPLQIIWSSPSGRYASEEVFYPADSLQVRYRTGIVPSETGEWQLNVSVSPEPAGMRGLGIIVATNTIR